MLEFRENFVYTVSWLLNVHYQLAFFGRHVHVPD